MSAVVSLGSNRGDRLAHLRAGLSILARRFEVTATSPVYETAPVGVGDQPPYLNCVAVLDSDDPEAVLAAAQDAEQSRGRLRSRRWGPRTLDVDVVSVDALIVDDPRLTLPHPRAHERAFVLVLWLDVDPEAVVPGRGPVRSLVRAVGTQGLRRWET
jgi:2-amino-4-hydroxy-6-hydroxymethyldihydropteridine diphosphokinase